MPIDCGVLSGFIFIISDILHILSIWIRSTVRKHRFFLNVSEKCCKNFSDKMWQGIIFFRNSQRYFEDQWWWYETFVFCLTLKYTLTLKCKKSEIMDVKYDILAKFWDVLIMYLLIFFFFFNHTHDQEIACRNLVSHQHGFKKSVSSKFRRVAFMCCPFSVSIVKRVSAKADRDSCGRLWEESPVTPLTGWTTRTRWMMTDSLTRQENAIYFFFFVLLRFIFTFPGSACGNVLIL